MSKKLVSLFLALLMVLSMTAVAMAEDTSITVVDMYDREVVLTEPVTRAGYPHRCAVSVRL